MSGPDTTQNIQITCRSLARPQSWPQVSFKVYLTGQPQFLVLTDK
jgi:hypothetical protein